VKPLLKVAKAASNLALRKRSSLCFQGFRPPRSRTSCLSFDAHPGQLWVALALRGGWTPRSTGCLAYFSGSLSQVPAVQAHHRGYHWGVSPPRGIGAAGPTTSSDYRRSGFCLCCRLHNLSCRHPPHTCGMPLVQLRGACDCQPVCWKPGGHR